jgi:hypothetical protein
MISIRTRIRIEFEDFEVDIPSCPQTVADGIWLEYGKGPKHSLRSGARDQLGLIQDSAFRKFDSYLRAVQKRKPLYAVSAALSGRFDTVPTTTCPDGQFVPAYVLSVRSGVVGGHLSRGCRDHQLPKH